jgi:hypothetical protein
MLPGGIVRTWRFDRKKKDMVFWLSACICSLYLKCILNIFENVKKNSNKKCGVYTSMFYVPTKWF